MKTPKYLFAAEKSTYVSDKSVNATILQRVVTGGIVLEYYSDENLSCCTTAVFVPVEE